MTTRTSAKRTPVAKRVPTKPQNDAQESIWSKLAIPAVVIVAILAMASIPLWGWIQQTLIPGTQPLAIVRDQTITMDQLVRRLRYERALLDLRQARPEEFASVPMQAVFDLVDQELIRQAVVRNGVPVTSDNIADEKVAISRQGLSGEAWSDIATANATRKAFERYLWGQLPSRVDQVNLVGFTTFTQRDAEAALTRIRNGESLDRVAADVSTTQRLKENGGEIGWTPRGLRGESFDRAVFDAAPGTLLGPIDTPEGFYVVRVLDSQRDRLLESAPLRELQSTSVRRWLDDERKRDPNAVQLFWDSEKYAWANDQVRK